MTFQIGDRVAVDVTWSEAYGVPCTIVDIGEDGIVARLVADEPCFDIGKYELSRYDDCGTEFLRKL